MPRKNGFSMFKIINEETFLTIVKAINAYADDTKSLKDREEYLKNYGNMLKDRICTFIDCQIEAYSKTWATVKVKERQRYLEADSADSPFRV